jgi:hypothetical protein
MRWSKGYIDDDIVWMSDEEPETKRSVWHLLRAQEHVKVCFVLDADVPFEEAWCISLLDTWPAWRVNPATIAMWLEQGEIDWRPNEITPEDFYAA